jgi:hypothetical protein
VKLLPDDPDARWNLLVVVTILVFGVWLVLIVWGQIFGDNAEVADDAILIGAAAGFMGMLLGQYRHGQKVDKIVAAVNHVEDDDVSLASALRTIDGKVDALAARLDEQAEREHPSGGPLAGGTVPTKRSPRRR